MFESERKERTTSSTRSRTSPSPINWSQSFSKLDANSGFWQIPSDPKSAKLTTFITPYGRYYFNRSPFGITSASEHFQSRISEILGGTNRTVSILDNILAFGKNEKEHDIHLVEALKRIEKAGITLNNEKCHSLGNELHF